MRAVSLSSFEHTWHWHAYTPPVGGARPILSQAAVWPATTRRSYWRGDIQSQLAANGGAVIIPQ